MTQNNNFSVLPWYDLIELQNHRRSYAYGNIYPLFAQTNVLLPFQIIRDHISNNLFTVKLYDKSGKFIKDISTEMRGAGLSVQQIDDKDVILFPGLLKMNTGMKEGIYYMSLTDGVNTWWSEMFTLVNDVSGYLKIEWYDINNLYFDAGLIIYDNPIFTNFLYLCTELGKPEYQFEEEGEDRDGYFFPEKRISEKTYRCTILASEYLCDVMRFISLSDYVRVTDKYGRKYDCDTFLITPEWQTQGDLASIEIEFETDTVVKKIGQAIQPSVDRIQLSVSPVGIEIPNAGGNSQFRVTSNYAWEITQGLSWVETNIDHGYGNTNVYINVTTQPDDERSGEIIIQTVDGSKSAIITIRQFGKSITISHQTLTFDADDVSRRLIQVESTDAWTSEMI